MKRFYFTFGSKHMLPRTQMFKGHELTGWSLGNHYVKIEAADMETARQLMFSVFGDQWSSSYGEETFQQVVKHGLKELIVFIPMYAPKTEATNENT